MKMNLLLKKIIFRTVIIIIGLFCLLYFSLWIYVYNFVPKELKTKYNQSIESYFDDEQYEIVIFSLSGNKKNEFTWYPFILDFIVTAFHRDNIITGLTTSTIAGEYFNENLGKYTSMDWHLMNYGLMRYIVVKNDYRKCINIIMEKCFMGENIFGIENASRYYFKKEIIDLSNEELVSLIVLSFSPTRFKIGSEENKKRVMKILQEY